MAPPAAARLLLTTTAAQPLTALRATPSSLWLLGSTGAAHVALPKGGAGKHSGAAVAWPPPQFQPCQGLQPGGGLVAAAFDVVYGTRAYGLAADGRVVTLTVGSNIRGKPDGACRLRATSRLPLPLHLPLWTHAPGPAQPAAADVSSGGGGSGSGGVDVGSAAGRGGAAEHQQLPQQGRQPGPGAALAGLPGYVLLSGGGDLLVLNVTAAAVGSPPALLLHQPLLNLSRHLEPLLLQRWRRQQQQQQQGQEHGEGGQEGQEQLRFWQAGAAEHAHLLASLPLVAADRSGALTAVGLGGGVVALFATGLPLDRSAAAAAGRGKGAPWLPVLQVLRPPAAPLLCFQCLPGQDFRVGRTWAGCLPCRQ